MLSAYSKDLPLCPAPLATKQTPNISGTGLLRQRHTEGSVLFRRRTGMEAAFRPHHAKP